MFKTFTEVCYAMADAVARESEYLEALCWLTLNPAHSEQALMLAGSLNETERKEFISLADSHHVVIRSMTPVEQHAAQTGNAGLGSWAAAVLKKEEARICNALTWLESICKDLEASGCPNTVMKSLDHAPDLGNDLDLYSTADEHRIVEVMTRHFQARIEPRSWGDRLANKWNFSIPGLPESVEVHVRRLGQTGEHTQLAQRFVTRRRPKTIAGRSYFVPAPEEQVIVATLQRMYRHFYFRICDIANSAAIIESGELDFNELRAASERAGIWPGVATYVQIVSDHVKRYRGTSLRLPPIVASAARFGGDQIKARDRFLRVPVLPHGAALYTHQVTKTAFRGDVPATFRLSLLPPLASAAAVAYRITGSDKGVW
jgi:hypothetical protein